MIAGAYMVPHPPLIVPEVGRGQEKNIQNTIDAYHEVGRSIGRLKPEVIVLISPHQTMYADYFHISPGTGGRGDFGRFQAGQVKMRVPYDTEFVEHLCRKARIAGLPAGTEGERSRELDHGTMVPLYFVNQYRTSCRLVRMGLSGLPLSVHDQLGQKIWETAEELDRRTVLIASGDLSHRLKPDGPYGYQKEGPEYDRRVMEIMGKGNFPELLTFDESFCERVGECGHRSFVMMAGALKQVKVTPRRLSYEGPFGVGYGICAYEVMKDGTES